MTGARNRVGTGAGKGSKRFRITVPKAVPASTSHRRSRRRRRRNNSLPVIRSDRRRASAYDSGAAV